MKRLRMPSSTALAEEWRSRMERRTAIILGRIARGGRAWFLSSLRRVACEEATSGAKSLDERTARIRSKALSGSSRLAEEAADWDEAARLARRLASLVGAQNPSPSMRHADFLERAGRAGRSGDRLAGAGSTACPQLLRCSPRPGISLNARGDTSVQKSSIALQRAFADARRKCYLRSGPICPGSR